MTKTALITGITGQDGTCLAELLLRKGYLLVAAGCRASSRNRERLDELGIANDEFVDFDLGADAAGHVRRRVRLHHESVQA